MTARSGTTPHSKSGDCMEEKIWVEFTGEEFDLILKYMDSGKFETVQEAILNAISIALDDCDK